MTAAPGKSMIIHRVVRDLRSTWKSLVIANIAFKVLAFAVITPLVGMLIRILLSISGSEVMSDFDILFFFLGPAGWITGIVAGALWLGIAAMEQATLLGVLGANRISRHPPPEAALRFAANHLWSVLRVTARMVTWMALAIAPVLSVAAIVYFALLTKYDINYYLQEKPPVFLGALGIAGVLAVLAIAIALRLISSWYYALPLVLFEEINPRRALQASSERVHGHRRKIVFWVAAWAASTFLVSLLCSGLARFLGQWLVPDSTTSLRWLSLTVGLALLVAMAANLVISIVSTSVFASMLLNIYEVLGNGRVESRLRMEQFSATKKARQFHLTRLRLLVICVLGVLVASLIGLSALNSIRLEDNVQVMAHRGSSKAAPENTLAAFQRAIDDGADWIELDVQESADGEVVVLHDSDFMKLSGVSLKIWNATMDDLRQLDVGSWFGPEFSDQRVPRLGEVLEMCRGKIGVNIELKYYGHEQQLEQRVAEVVDAHQMNEDVMAMSLKMKGVRKMKAIRPDWKVGLLMSVSAGNQRKLAADFLAINANFASRSVIQTAHRNGRAVYVWTVNDAPTMSAMISRGVDGLLTDRPALARSVLQQRAQMSTPERLLLEIADLLGAEPQIVEQ